MGRSEAAALLKLAESIADGSGIDWEAAEASASHDDKAVIRQLRILSNLAVLHRSLPEEPAGGPDGSMVRRTSESPAIGNWAHLTLLERLGGGTFGDVYRAWDRHLEREVALKLLRVEEAGDDLSNSRIAREGRLLARIRHQHVITVHGVDAYENRVGLWMDLVRGVTLEEQLAAHGPFSATEAAAVGIDLCRALAAIHSAGLIHRDVKAQNVMREEGGRIVLMDLGTGREADRAIAGGVPELAGTPLYLAPEIFLGSPASPKTDVYSLGVLLYHLATGSFPVKAATFDQLQQAHANGELARLRDARADLPTAFVRVVDRAIAPEPARRYQSAGQLEADLADAIGRPAPAAGEGRPPSRFRALTAWPTAALAAAAVVVVIGALALPWPPPFLRAHVESIAVLPLANLSSDASQEYFADGMTDLLIGDLARIRALRVISRTSAMQYKGTNKSLKDVAKALNVDAVLEGTVLRSGSRVRISADLVEASTDKHLWAETYERDVKDLLALQNEVAQAIARQVQIKLTPQEQAGFTTATAIRQVDPAAQDAYLQGRYYWNTRTPDGLQRALAYFRQAATIDPSFALAYAGQADAYNLLPGSMMPAVAYPQAKAAAAHALQLDPTLGEAHASLAFATFIFDRDWASADASFQRALQYNPGYATAHHWYGEYLSAMGRLDEAIAVLSRAKALDPLSPGVRASLGSTYYAARRYDEAIAEIQSSFDVDASSPSAYLFLAMSYEGKRDLDRSMRTAQRGLELNPNSTTLRAQLGRVAALQGRRADALAAAAELERTTTARVNLDDIASIYALLGDNDRAFDFLRRAEQERSPGLLWSRLEEIFDPLRSDPRFADLTQRLGFTQ